MKLKTCLLLVLLTGCGKAIEPPPPPPKAPPGKVTLSWTAPGDDGDKGTATAYDLRYSTSPITEANFSKAFQITGVPAPHIAGTHETFVATGLIAGVKYFFAIKTVDEVGNWSDVSNSPNSEASPVISVALVAVPEL